MATTTRRLERTPSATRRERLHIEIRGAVQGVGFRPFVYRLAHEFSLTGWVINDTRGVCIEVEGPRARLDSFVARLASDHPVHAHILSVDQHSLEPAGSMRFEIRTSRSQGSRTAVPLPDLATCDACLADVLDPADRRYRYPFTNCTECGPRFTILQDLPYDRRNTTMRTFPLCGPCRCEYEAPLDRRFHAQPTACPTCGPKLALRDASRATLAAGDDALIRAGAALRSGRVVAVKGLGGFHLMCDAADERAVTRIRERKPRLDKPLALMVRDLAQARELCDVNAEAERALTSPEAPIVLMPRLSGAPVAPNVAPGYPTLGLMLPATPLHHLLMRELGRPIVATSGNLADEPIATDDMEAIERLGSIAQLWLGHDRPIERHMDDSVGWVLGGRFRLLRRARGYAPLPVSLPRSCPPILAVGAHLKNAIALGVEGQVFLGQHVGDLESPEAVRAFERVIADFLRLYGVHPHAIAHDLHPDYVATQWARSAASALFPAPSLIAVQHHHAHLAACLAEHGAEGSALGVTWDGTGYGGDGTVWGGEFLLGDAASYRRVAHLAPFRLPGGEEAVREPRRVALALLWELLGDEALERTDFEAVRSFSDRQRGILARMLRHGVNAPITTSAGRLFDGVAALLGLRLHAAYEGQAAAELEFEADPAPRGAYPFALVAPADRVAPAGVTRLACDAAQTCGPSWVVDWRPALQALLEDVSHRVARATIASRFHDTLAAAIVSVARGVGEPRVALTGGCFQNRALVERACSGLAAAGHEVLLHQRVPPNDGGISLGQVAVAAARLASTPIADPV